MKREKGWGVSGKVYIQYNEDMNLPFHLSYQSRDRFKWLFVSILVAVVIAFFVDQYYILGKKWYFLLELVQ